MKKTALVFAILMAAAASASATLDSLWMRTYGGPENDGFRSVIRSTDGGAVAVGYTYSFGPANSNVFAVKVDDNGNTLWTRAYGGDGMDYGCGVCETGDGCYVIAGYTMSSGAGREDVYLLKINASGDTVWTRTYGGPESDEARAVCATGDGYVVVTGCTDSYGAGENDLYLLKVDSTGDTVWTRTYGSSRFEWGQGVCETQDNCYAACGTSDSLTLELDIYMVKVDADGNLIWENFYGEPAYSSPDWGMDVDLVADTALVVAGYVAIEIRDVSDACLVTVDLDGNETGGRKWKSSYYQYANSVCPTHDGGQVFVGTTKLVADQTNDLLLLKRLPSLGFVDIVTLGGAGNDWGSCVAQASPGVYLVAGHTNSYGSGGFDGWLVAMAEPGAAADGGLSTPGAFLASPVPNPLSDGTAMRFGLSAAGQIRLAVYDVSGRRVALLEDGLRKAGEHTARWDGRDDAGREVSPGIYVARLDAGAFSTTAKVVVLR
jgi:hypothetical protein